MVFLRKDNDMTVFVVCPAFHKTGGTELAHQLVFELNKIDVSAIITYYDYEKYKDPINEEFRQYVKSYETIDNIIDSEENFILVPEINFSLLNNYSNIRKGIWWMSVDNYLKNDGFINGFRTVGFINALKAVLGKRNTLFAQGFDKDALHFYQSEYAHQFLINEGVKESNISKLSDYVNDLYLEKRADTKKNKVVLYNPKKGYDFTKKLINKSNGIKWIAIENLTTQQVKELLSESMVYIDFGNHPGKDRFPREAAISGCCIITGLNGSAKYYEDIPIPDDYKFEKKESNISAILDKVTDCLENYDSNFEKFATYRNMIRNEHSVFCKDVKAFVKRIGVQYK